MRLAASLRSSSTSTRSTSSSGIRPLDDGGVAFGDADARAGRRALAAGGRAAPGAGRGAAADRSRVDPQPRHHRRIDRPRRRIGRAARGRRRHRRRDGGALRRAASGSCRPTTSSSATSPRRSTTTSCSPRSASRLDPPAPAGRSTRSPAATATSRSSASPRWSPLDGRTHRRGAPRPHGCCRPRRCGRAAAEAALAGQPVDADTIAAAAARRRRTWSPASDIHGSAEFRRHLAGVAARRALDHRGRRAQEERHERRRSRSS